MNLPELTLEERAALKREQAHRFPELLFFPKPGDDGKPVKLPIVLGNPPGACKMPHGVRVSKLWDEKVARTFGALSGGTDDPVPMSQLVAECVMWPSAPVWTEWLERWPALGTSVGPALVHKYGGAMDQVGEPDLSAAPDVIASARADAPGSTFMRFQPKGATVDLLVKAPSSGQWALFTEAMKRPDAGHWDLVLQLATACTAASTMALADAFLRWPGLALQIDREAAYLAGLNTEYEEGEL